MVRKLKAPDDGQGRVETGAVQFGDDWNGLFIRGDNAIGLRGSILTLLEYLNQYHPEKDLLLKFAINELRYYAEIIDSDVDERNTNRKPLKSRK